MHRLPAALTATFLLVALSACSDDADSGSSAGDPTTDSTPSAAGPTGTRTEPDPTQPDQAQPDEPVPTPTVAGTLATGLTSPWGLTFLPGGGALVSERDTALIKRIDADGTVSTVGEVPGVDTTSTEEGGLLGIALHPDYPEQPYLYAYLTDADDNQVVRMTYRDGSLGSPRAVLDGIPKAEYHNGGRIGFGPDGMLYATTGDATDGGNSSDPDSLGGKVLRVTPTGRPAPGNPTPGSPVYSSGHRNGQGIAWDDEGRLWQAEFGQDTWDELNLIRPGADYGWPECEGACDEPGFVDPLEQWPTAEASPSGIAFSHGAIWMAGLRGERLWGIDVAGDGVVGEPAAFFSGEYGRLRTVAAAPDGSLWLVTSNTDGRGDPAADDDTVLRLTLD